ncbi:MAG: phosphopantothenoylcysteine decarboxylase [Oligoflexia bacterium]|nr:MAG: phosphopantothenoylcysteine decarboxylase [Oligoflexia bacterium]
MSKSKILFIMTGSIACYKACALISKLVQNRFEVQVVATKSALQFVGNATLEGLTGKPVVSDMWERGTIMDHIHLSRWADLVLVCPATANYINKISQGVGDDIATTLFLSHQFEKPFLIAPAMNTAMYLHPVTAASIQKLKALGVGILETASGVLACGEVGYGKLLDPELIFHEIETALKRPASTQTQPIRKSEAKKILITSGGTAEPIDQVRVLSNKSTGTTGAHLADVLIELGFDVTYLHAKNAVRPQNSCEKVTFETFLDLERQLQSLLKTNDYAAVIHAAAVSDFSILSIQAGDETLEPNPDQKISSESEVTIRLKRNPKLLDQIRDFSKNSAIKIVAFKMTATHQKAKWQEAVNKVLSRSKPDLVIHNDMSEMNWDTGLHIFHAHQSGQDSITLNSKTELGQYLGQYLSEVLI